MDFTEAKSKLKQYSADHGYDKPAYEVVSKRHEDVRKIYKVRVTVEGLVETTGEGYSRRLAEHWAAINALQEIDEVREEQRKSREEQKDKDLNESTNDLNRDNDTKVTNGSDDRHKDAEQTNGDKESDRPVNGDHNDQEMTVNDNNHSNSITISADINTSAEEEVKPNGVLTNGHNSDDQSISSSDNCANNNINDKNDNNFVEDIDNSATNDGKINGRKEEKPSVRTFAPLSKTSVQKLQEFCMSQQSPFPFYDSTFRDDSFRIKCRIEFTADEEKREFFGTGFGDSIKEAKLMAAEDIIKQLTELKLI